MFNLRAMATIIVAATFVGPLTSESSAGRFWSFSSPTENDEFSSSSNIGTIGSVTSNDEETPANNLNILVRIKNVSSGTIMDSFTTTTMGMDWSYAEWLGDLEAPSGGWTTGMRMSKWCTGGVM